MECLHFIMRDSLVQGIDRHNTNYLQISLIHVQSSGIVSDI